MIKSFITKTRWLVTIILLLSLSVTQMWGASTATYTVASKTSVSKSGTAPSGSSATFSQSGNNEAGQMTANGTTTLTLSGYDGKKITGISLYIKKTSGTKTAAVTATTGATYFCSYTIASNDLSTSFKTKVATLSFTPIIADDATITIGIKASANSVYISAYYITWEDATPYDVSFSTGAGNPSVATRRGATITLPDDGDLTPTCFDDGWTLYGWATEAYGSASTTSAPLSTFVGYPGDTYYPSGDITLYAVYAKLATDVAASAQTLSFAYSSSSTIWKKNHYTDKSTYWLIHGTDGYIESPIMLDLSKITSIVVQAGYFGGSAYGKFRLSGAGTNYGSEQSCSNSTESTSYTVTPSPNPLSGKGTVKLVCTGTAHAENGVRIKTITINYTAPPTYYWSAPTCSTCDKPTALTKGSINSSSQTVSWTAPSSAPANGYLVAYSTSTSTNPADNVYATNSDYTIMSVSAGTTTANIPCNTAGTYNWWVRSKCSADNSSLSGWVKGTAFTMKQIYLQVNANWANDNADFVAYYWNADPKTGFTKKMTEQTDCEDRIYTCVFPTDYSNIKFVRLNPIQVDPVVNFDNRWSETGNLTLAADKNYYQITGGEHNSVTGSWSTYAQKVTVSFDKNTTANGVTNPSSQCVVVTSGRATEPTIGNMSHGRLGYQLSGWKDGGTTWNFSTMGFTADKELTAYWTTGATTTVYLKTSWSGSGNTWIKENAIVFARFYIDGTTQFEEVQMTKACDDVYTAEAPYGTTHVSFARCASGTSAPLGDWGSNGNVYNYVAGLAIGSTHYFAITGWGAENQKVGTATTQGSAYVVPTYAISYNKGTTPNAGKSISGSRSNDTKNCDEDFTLPNTPTVFSVEGYSQTGWTTSDGSSQTHALGGTYDVNAAQAFYPVWTINSHTLTWAFAGGESSETAGTNYTAGGTKTYGTAITYPSNASMSKTGYEFNGWSSSPSGNPSSMPDADLTITAQWNTVSYNITYNLNSGSGASNTTYTIESSTITLPTAPTVSKTGYTFGGWYTNSSFTGDAVTTIANGSTGDKEYWAKWTPITFAVQFDKNGGSGDNMSNQAFTYDVAQNLSANTYTAPEHKYFLGWNTNSGASVATYTDKESVSNLSSTNGATVTLYAIWANHTFTNYRTLCESLFDIVLDDGLVATTNNGSAKVANNGTTLTNIVAPTKSGYDVEGYYTTSGLTTKIATDAGALQNGSGSGITVGGNAWTNSSSQWVRGAGETFYTKWIAHTYDLTYDGLEGATHSNPATYTIETATITLTNPSARTGYTFTGWTCGGDAITSIALGSTGDKTITANWTINKHTVAVSAADHVTITATPAGGSAIAEGSSASNVNYGTTVTLNCTPDAHWNLAWDVYKTGESSTKVAITGDGDGATFTLPDYNVTVTAVMTEDTYHTATFKNNGAVIDGYDAVKTYDGERPSAPTLTDVTDACDKTECNKFYGWIAEAGIWDKTINSVAGKTIYRSASSIPVVDGANVVYHAVWAKGEGAPESANPLLVKWAQQSLSSTPVAGVKADGTASTATLASSKSLTAAYGTYAYGESGMGSSDITITISGLDFSGYNSGAVSFYVRASQGRTLTIKESSGGDYSTVTTSSTSVDKFHVIRGISNTTTSIQIIYPTAATAGSFYIGTFRVFGINTSTSYTFTKLTSSNTSGWTTDDWDGYYIIADGTAASSLALDGGGIYGDGPTTVTVTDGTTITTSDPTKAFEIKYDDTEGKYTIQGIGCRDYVCNSGKPVPAVFSASFYNSIAYNEITATSGNYLRKHSSNARFGVYTGENRPTLYKVLETFTEFRITCCDKTVTIGTPDKTGSGTVTFASGGDAYAAGDEVETCAGTTTITATVTPTNGYKCTALEFTRSDSEDLTPDPAISVPFTGAQSYDLTFEQNADDVTLNTTVTFVALIDHYIDNMHYNTTQNKSGNYGTAPTLSDTSKGEQCTGLHYKFIGWIPETDMNMTTGVPTTTANMVAGGATGKYATGTNYYAIWAEEE